MSTSTPPMSTPFHPVYSDSAFWNNVNKLNKEQRTLFNFIKFKIERGGKQEESSDHSDQLLLFVSGGVGTGKSFLLQFIAELIREYHSRPQDGSTIPSEIVQVCALTGRAAQQILGKTLHSLFPLSIHRGHSLPPVSQSIDKEQASKLKQMQWLIIDDISLVSYENLRTINKTLQEFKNNEKKVFGGVNVLLFGDLMQLSPVDGHWCFKQPLLYQAEVNPWNEFCMYELTTNIRQSRDIEYARLLDTLRFGLLDDKQRMLLRSREKVPMDGIFENGNALRIFQTNELVNQYNMKMAQILRDEGLEIFKIHAVDTCMMSGQTPPQDMIPQNDNYCGGLPSSIELGVGMRVMLKREIPGADELVNGVVGAITGFIWATKTGTQNFVGQMPKAVEINFDDPALGPRTIRPVTARFEATVEDVGFIVRYMLPIVNLGWAMTFHKLQGTTLESAVVDLSNIFRQDGHAKVYVALGSVKSLEGLALPNLDINVFDLRPDSKAKSEMCRLREQKRIIIRTIRKVLS